MMNLNRLKELSAAGLPVALAPEQMLEMINELEALRADVERYRSHLNACTGIPAAAGICEPIEGYADAPSFLPSALRAMCDVMNQRVERIEALKGHIHDINIELENLNIILAAVSG